MRFCFYFLVCLSLPSCSHLSLTADSNEIRKTYDVGLVFKLQF